MADSTSENIGGINVGIGADYSDLAAAFNSAQDLAQQAGTNIADALASGAASGADLGEQISEQLSAIAPAADDAASALEGAGSAAEYFTGAA